MVEVKRKTVLSRRGLAVWLRTLADQVATGTLHLKDCDLPLPARVRVSVAHEAEDDQHELEIELGWTDTPPRTGGAPVPPGADL